MMIIEKNELLKKQKWSKTDFLIEFLHDSEWFCMEKLKKHSFETKKQKEYQQYPTNPKKYVKTSLY